MEGDTSNVVFCALSSVSGLILLRFIISTQRNVERKARKKIEISRRGLSTSTWPRGYGRYVTR